MTVKELQDMLSKQNPESEVIIPFEEYSFYVPTWVRAERFLMNGNRLVPVYETELYEEDIPINAVVIQ